MKLRKKTVIKNLNSPSNAEKSNETKFVKNINLKLKIMK